MADSGIEFLVKKSEGQWHIQGDMSVIKKYDLHHTVIPPWIYRIPSELRSQTPSGPVSTAVGDHVGTRGVACSFALCPLAFVLGCVFIFTCCRLVGGSNSAYPTPRCGR